MKTCISCGMPMTSPGDFPLDDQTKDYCVHCARPDGSLQSYEEKLTGTTAFLVRTQGFDRSAAHHAAIRLMAQQPAWKNRGGKEDASNERPH